MRSLRAVRTFIRGAAFGTIELLNPLISAGLLIPAGHVASITCLECSAPHCSEVESVVDQVGWNCPEAGFVTASPFTVAAFEVRPEVLARRLRHALGGMGTPGRWPSKSPMIWELGTFEIGRLAVAACLVPNVAELEIFNELCRFLRTYRRHPHGTAVLTNDCRDMTAVLLPDGVRIVRLPEVTMITDEGGVKLDITALVQRVLPSRLVAPPKPGRDPAKREMVIRIIGELDRQGKLAGLSERTQQKLVHAVLKEELGEDATLGRGTFCAALAIYRAGV